MQKLKKQFLGKIKSQQHGGMMVELLMTIALVAIILPFIVSFQKSRIMRAEDIVITQDMERVQSALEKYIDFHKKDLLKTIGKNITRINLSDLEEYGINPDSLKKYGDNFQIRILKSNDRTGHSTLQGIIVLNNKNISPMRTREIINLGDNKMGFVEQGKAFGTFGTWNGDAVDFGIEGLNGIVNRTKTTINGENYLWRLPSENDSDATMLSDLNLNGHSILNSKLLDSDTASFNDYLTAKTLVSDNLVFQNRTTLDKELDATNATVAGTLSSDSRAMEISNTLTLTDTGKFSGFTTDNLWVNTLNLSGLSVLTDSDNQATVLSVNQTIDMISGHITAMYTTVGFDGSITPKLVVRDKIQDSSNSAFYWNFDDSSASFSDVSFAELDRMVIKIVKSETDTSTVSGQIFKSVSANKNATASDYMNAISEIQKKVKAKYSQLNLN